MKFAIIILLISILIPVTGYCQTKIYAEVEDGKVRNIFEWKETLIPNLGPKVLIVNITQLVSKPNVGYLYDGVNFTTPPPPVILRIITKKELWSRFTETEKNTIISSANVKVRRFILEIPILEEFNLEDTKVINAIKYLETTGLIVSGRADQILQ